MRRPSLVDLVVAKRADEQCEAFDYRRDVAEGARDTWQIRERPPRRKAGDDEAGSGCAEPGAGRGSED
jgi:hypothetical protein